VGRVEPIAADDERSLEIHVPTEEAPLLVPEQLDRVCVSFAHEAEDVAALPDVVVRGRAADPILEISLPCDAFHQLPAGAGLAEDPVAPSPLADVVVRPAPADDAAIAAPQQ